MRKLVLVLAATAAVAGVGAGVAQAKLTPIENTWAKPMIAVWNEQNVALQVVIAGASAKNALFVGTASNAKLETILNTFVVCGSLIKKAGAPPSPRLEAYLTPLTTACTHNTAGATDFAKAIGAVGKGNSKLANSYLAKGIAAFKLGSMALKTAYKSLITIGGKSIFVA